MTGLEDSVKGTLFYIDKDGEYKEIGTIKKEVEIDIEDTEDIEEYIDTRVDTKSEFEISIENNYKTQKFIRQIRLLCKSDKERKAEKIFNKQSFRNFIKQRR